MISEILYNYVSGFSNILFLKHIPKLPYATHYILTFLSEGKGKKRFIVHHQNIYGD